MDNADIKFMSCVIELAKNARPSPNPRVAAVLVSSQDEVISMAYHKAPGQPHAEAIVLEEAKDKAAGSTLYVNLEPCTHWGRTPPCVGAIIEAKVKRVVIAMQDPNPTVSGKGIASLREAGIEVKVGVLQSEAEELNEPYIVYMQKKRPFTLLKLAMTMDGKINGGRRITSCVSRDYLLGLRCEFDAIVIGKNTAIIDDPILEVKGAQPKRVILASKLDIPNTLRLFSLAEYLLVVGTQEAPQKRINELRDLRAQVWIVKDRDRKVDLCDLWQAFYKASYLSVIVEGGGELAKSVLEADLVDKMLIFLAPTLGGEVGLQLPKRYLSSVSIKRIGQDILIEGYVHRHNS